MMKQQIVVTNFNSTQFLKTLGKFGNNYLGLRFLNPLEFAKYVLEINGKPLDIEILSYDEQTYVIYNLLKGIDYFNNSSFEDAKKCALAINELRSLTIKEDIIENEFVTTAEFIDKNIALNELFEKYKSYKENNNLKDRIDVIKDVLTNAESINICVSTIKEEGLSYLERQLAKDKGIEFCELSLSDLFLGDGSFGISKYVNAYGSSNEVEEVISDIYSNNINPDEVTLILLSPEVYLPLIKEYSELYNIPVLFNEGQCVSKSNPYNLLKLINKWDTSGYHSIDAYKELINSPCFNKTKLLENLDKEKYSNKYNYDSLIKTLGSLKFSFDKNENERKYNSFLRVVNNKNEIDIASDAKKIADEFSNGYKYIIEKYTVIRSGKNEKFDNACKSAILNELSMKELYIKDNDIELIIDSLAKKRVLRDFEKPGSIVVSSLNNAYTCLRPYIYVLGMSADNFPGNNKENSLILDNDYKIFTIYNEELEKYVNTSDKVIKNNIKSFITFLEIACRIGSKITLSYSSYNLTEIKTLNPSSVLFEIYLKEFPNATMKEFEKRLVESSAYYFKNKISPIDVAGRKYINKETKATNNNALPEIEINKQNKTFSPTHIEKFVNCPRLFYYAVMLQLEENEKDDPYILLDVRDVGNAVHGLMEFLANNKVSKEEFTNLVNKSFDELLVKRPPLDNTNIVREKSEFIRMCLNGYQNYKDRVVISAEKRIKKDNAILHPSGISLYGSPDVVELNEDGTLTIGDYKTGKKIKHHDNDLLSCIQTAIYAYITETIENKKVTNLEYRYLRNNREIHCAYNNEKTIELSNLLRSLNSAIDSGEFDCTEEKDHCKYCSFSGICEGAKTKGDKEDE